MPSILTTPPAAEPVSLADAKAHLRVPHTDEDSFISTLITAARSHVETMTGLRLLSQGWSIYLDDWPPARVIELPIAPVLTVQAVRTYDLVGVATTVSAASYLLDNASRPPRLVLANAAWTRPGRIANGIEVAITAGFGAAAGDVPAALREAVLKLVAHWFAYRGDDEGARMLPPSLTSLLLPFREARL